MSDELTQAILELVDADDINHPRQIRQARQAIAIVITDRWKARHGDKATPPSEEAVNAILMASPVPELTGEIIQRHAPKIARLVRPVDHVVDAEPRRQPPAEVEESATANPVELLKISGYVQSRQSASGEILVGADEVDPTGLTVEIIDELKKKGYTQSEIARMYGVSRQAVSWHKRTYSGRRTPREAILEDHFPWQVSKDQGRCSAYRRLRDHGEYLATDGVGMSEEKLSRLRGFYRKLRDDKVVLEYDPKIPPQDGFASKGGFALRPRTRRDGDLMIRVNEYTNLTDEGREIWRLPRVLP